MVERGRKADNVKPLVLEKTHSQHALLPTLGELRGASLRGTRPDPGALLRICSF